MNGGAKRIRTAGLVIANDALYQLSYSPTKIEVADFNMLPDVELCHPAAKLIWQLRVYAFFHNQPALVSQEQRPSYTRGFALIPRRSAMPAACRPPDHGGNACQRVLDAARFLWHEHRILHDTPAIIDQAHVPMCTRRRYGRWDRKRYYAPGSMPSHVDQRGRAGGCSNRILQNHYCLWRSH